MILNILFYRRIYFESIIYKVNTISPNVCKEFVFIFEDGDA